MRTQLYEDNSYEQTRRAKERPAQLTLKTDALPRQSL